MSPLTLCELLFVICVRKKTSTQSPANCIVIIKTANEIRYFVKLKCITGTVALSPDIKYSMLDRI